MELFSKRRSIFPAQFLSTPLSKEEIEQLLKVANYAPSHRNTEPWRFKVMHTEESKKKLASFLQDTYVDTTEKVSTVKLRKIGEKPIQSGAVIAICMQRDPKESVPEWEELAAVSMAVQNLWLYAQTLSIGGYWSSPKFLEHFGDFTTLEDGESCIGLFYLGKIDSSQLIEKEKGAIAEKVQWL